MTNHRTAQFHNFSDEEFVGYWNGRPKTFKPGAKMLMDEYLARHFATHLTNRELLKKGKETLTSPKFPEQVPEFMEVFNKAFFMEEDQVEKDEADASMEIANSPVSSDMPGTPAKVETPVEEPKETLTPQQKAANTRAANKAAKEAKTTDDEASEFEGAK